MESQILKWVEACIFYPKDDTPGCTIEACNFRDSAPDFSGTETQILRVSFDDAPSHQATSNKHFPS